MEAKLVIDVVGTDCPLETEEKFNKWYNDTHVPDLLKFEKIKRVTRFKILNQDTKYPKFLAIYEFDNRQAFEEYFASPVRGAGVQDWTKVSKELSASLKWLAQYEVIKTWHRS